MDTWLFEVRLGVVLKGMRSSLRGESPVGCWPTSLQGQQAKSPQSQQVESPPSRREASCLEFPLIDESILESIEKATQGLRDELSELAVVHRPELVTAGPPSGNGTAATNGRDMEASAARLELATAAAPPEASGPEEASLTDTQELLLAALDELTASQGNRSFASHLIAKQANMSNPDQPRYREQLKNLSDKGYCKASSKGYARTPRPYPPQALSRQSSD
jgi:hypothetical protein